MTLTEQRRFKRRLLRKIAQRSATASFNPISAALIARECNAVLASHPVQCATFYDIWAERFDATEAATRWAAAQQQPVMSLDSFRPDIPVAWHNKPRTTSGCRKICLFPDTEKMWHILARELLVAQHQPRPHIGDWRGRGRDWQIQRLMAAINSSEQAIVCADIRRAFASVDIDAAYQFLPLPEPLIRRAIDYRSHRFVRREGNAYARELSLAVREELEVPPSGLMEGSPASNAIFSMMIDDLPDHLDERVTAFVYCDNIIILAPSISLAQQAAAFLVEYVTGHRAGPFSVEPTIQSVCDDFEHLGYSLRWNERTGVSVGLSMPNWLKWVTRVQNRHEPLLVTLKWLSGSFGCCTPDTLGLLLEGAISEARARDADQQIRPLPGPIVEHRKGAM